MLMISKSIFSKLAMAGLLISLGFLTGCGANSAYQSSIKVTGGNSISRSDRMANPVVALRTIDGGLCTGTFINATTVITAAHCALSEKSGSQTPSATGGFSLFQAPTESSTKAVIPSDDARYHNVNSYLASARDISIVTFTASASQALNITSFAQISDTAPAKDSDVSMVGYGMAELGDHSSVGKLRIGTNKIVSISNGIIRLIGTNHMESKPGMGASAPGDSGGPLFDENGDIVGLTSTHTENHSDRHISTYVDLTSSIAKNFVQSQVK